MTSVDRQLKSVIQKDNFRDNDPEKVSRSEFNRIADALENLNEYVFEKVEGLVKSDSNIVTRIERLEKKVYEEPDAVAAFMKSDFE
jgi:ribosomal 50S subunit-associated protein YjgA (DUF615 family)